MPTRKGAIRIFRLFGIDVYLSWWWIAFAFIRIQFLRYRHYDSPVWALRHRISDSFRNCSHARIWAHALACKQVGGQANLLIVLWPLGGVAYVSPPQRPGAMLWSIAAGPLVNVALVPVFSVFWYCSYLLGWAETHEDVYQFLRTIWQINLGLLIFNMLPVFPLDGGQILRSLLWYPFGRGNSLFIVSIIGFFGVVGGAFVCFAGVFGWRNFYSGGWLGLIDFFVASELAGAKRHSNRRGDCCDWRRRRGERNFIVRCAGNRRRLGNSGGAVGARIRLIRF